MLVCVLSRIIYKSIIPFHSIQGNPSISKKEPDGGSTLPIKTDTQRSPKDTVQYGSLELRKPEIIISSKQKSKNSYVRKNIIIGGYMH
jgi:hypothetical protein